MDERTLGSFEQIASVREMTFSEGKEKGQRLLHVHDNVLSFFVELDHAFDLFQLAYRGTNMSFLSPNGMAAYPNDFLRSFPGGMLYTCGLDSIGDRPGFPLHGHFHENAAILQERRIDEKGIFLRADITDSALFSPTLILHRTLFIPRDSGTIELEDVLENRSASKVPYCLLYHFNSGYPLLAPGCFLQGLDEVPIPRTPFAERNLKDFAQIGEPVDEQEEACYFFKQSRRHVELINPQSRIKFQMDYSKSLPYLVEWKCQRSGTYVLGLEPATSWLDDRFKYRTLEPGEKVSFSVKLHWENIPEGK